LPERGQETSRSALRIARHFSRRGQRFESVSLQRRVTGADFERAVALLVTIGAGEDEVVIGGASYFVSGSVTAAGRSAELAFTVEEDFQGCGIGSLLMRHIIAIARVKGLDRLEADVLSRNRPMLNVFRRCGLPMAVRHEGDVIHVILSLREAG
jgi:GNAT superfamily N-acetyltransferase